MAKMLHVMTRAEWQKLRDGAKVPKGAGGRVSIGDSIEAVHKSYSAATVTKNEAATQQLIRDIDSYVAAIKTKHPTFAPVVIKKLRAGAVSHLALLKTINAAKTDYYPDFVKVQQLLAKGDQTTNGDLHKAFTKLKGDASVLGDALDDAVWKKRARTGGGAIAALEKLQKTSWATQADAFKKALDLMKP
jgi:uncharacterized short protein YbdD (DUF466 family)